ncbi:hypothetical protein [Streptomyces sp. NPDC003717]|uniref:hypothetical protein n=1 Tax=Streptomyces sp. NPDC003717 TaxID=3154276 RepID=UPI0033A17108
MPRLPRTLPALSLLLLLALTACGTERAGTDTAAAGEAGTRTPAAGDAGPGTPAAGKPRTGTARPSTPATASPASPASHGDLDARARALGVAPELVYVTTAPGFTLVAGSVGVYGADGFSASWYSPASGARLSLFVDRGTLTGDTCAALPMEGAARPACERDGDAWYRTGAGRHEYAVPGDGHVLRVSAESAAVPRAALRAAALGAHRPDAAETAALLPAPAPAPTAPLERGDLPANGDGAPRNDVGVGG